MATTTNAPKVSTPEHVYVAGIMVTEQGGIALILKDKVSKNKLLSAKVAGATKTATVFVAQGYTIEEVKEAYPYGTIIEDASWGEPKNVIRDGKALTGVYDVVGM